MKKRNIYILLARIIQVVNLVAVFWALIATSFQILKLPMLLKWRIAVSFICLQIQSELILFSLKILFHSHLGTEQQICLWCALWKLIYRRYRFNLPQLILYKRYLFTFSGAPSFSSNCVCFIFANLSSIPIHC